MLPTNILLLAILALVFSCKSNVGNELDFAENSIIPDTSIIDSFSRDPYHNQIVRQNSCWTPTPQILYIDNKLGKVWNYADEMPEFPGGIDSINAILQKGLEEDLSSLTIYGNRVRLRSRIQFVVDTSGIVRNIKSLQSSNVDFDLKAIAILRRLPRFTPAHLGGKTANVQLILPICYEFE